MPRRLGKDDKVTNGVILSSIRNGDLIGGPKAPEGLLASSLDENYKFVRDDVLRRYLDWWKSEGFDTGPIANAEFEQISKSEDPEFAANTVDRLAGGMTAGVPVR